MSVIIRLQNLPWSANALDIRNYFRGLSIPEGGVHIVGGELGDAFIAFSTDEDARQAMMLDGGKIKEIQVKLLLSSRSEMHKVIETARQSVPILTLTAPAAPAAAPAAAPVQTTTPAQMSLPTPPQPAVSASPIITPFSAALGTVPLSSYGIPGIGNPHEIPQPAVIEPPAPMISPSSNTQNGDDDKEDDRNERKLSKEKDRRRSRTRSRSRERDRKDRKRDRRDRSRSRDRRRRDRSRSRERRDRKRDRKDRSRSRERSPARRSRDRRNERITPRESQEKVLDNNESSTGLPFGSSMNPNQGQPMQLMQPNTIMPNGPAGKIDAAPSRFSDPTMADAFTKLQELGKKRNPNAFQGDANGAPRFPTPRGGANAPRGGGFRREGRVSRFDDPPRDCCVAIRNAPNHTGYGDIRRFFPYLIDKHGIKMINDSTGRRTGNIFVRFCDPRSRQLALQSKTNELKDAIVTVEPIDDEIYENAVDSFLPYREENDDEDLSLVIADDAHSARTPYSVLKLADLPNYVKEHDIIKAFSDFSLLSIMLNDCRITRSKVAFVQFVKPEDARLAYERKDLYVFGRHQAIVTPVHDEEYEKEKLMISEKSTDQKLRNEAPEEPVLPRDPRQRRQLADSSRQLADNVRQLADSARQASAAGPPPPGQMSPAGQFFPNVPFIQQQNFGAPFSAVQQFGGFPGTAAMDPRTAAANWANRPAFPNQTDQLPMLTTNTHESPDMDDQPLDCVLMKGLPQEATDRTIVTFLSDTGAVPARIHLMLDSNGMPSGDCFCEFRSIQEARQAASKHGQNLDGCRVTVDLVSRKVVEDALEGPKQSEGISSKPPQFYDHPRGGFGTRPYRGRGSFDRGGFERGSYRGNYDRGGYRGRGHWAERGSRGSDRGSRGSERGSRGSERGSRGSERGSRGSERGSRGYERSRGRGFGRGRGGYAENGNREMRNEEDSDPALEGFGAPGCIVTMENVPFRATVDDILSFFSDFELTQDDIIRRYNERGQPTGDARVAFRTPYEAQEAVKTRHMDSIHDRRISLAIL